MCLDRVSYRYRRGSSWILRDLVLDLAPGEIVEITGRNGTGKSTLLRLAAGLHRPRSGTITGRPPRVGYAPERFPTHQPFTVRAYLHHMAAMTRPLTGTAAPAPGNLTPTDTSFTTPTASASGATAPTAAASDAMAFRAPASRATESSSTASSSTASRAISATAAIEHWASQLRFEHLLDTRLSELSKGSAQKVGLAQALLPSPDLLVLDEPFAGLDAETRDALPELLESWAADGTTILVSDHQGALSQTSARRLQLQEGALHPLDGPTWTTLHVRVRTDEADALTSRLREEGHRVTRS
ncbi:ATP-binding cassette domain-containing protein [Actinomadura parmotrematis]|uniref:ATP-binding cassette domain-containing protein n=1 Tax=Actinomadura parmotrematis TaxID=2864039 RepID=A0ABS7G0J2_9ACTN|nr:ATP-binding cassette domain-containing protein [Actinomadura parmotrematis]MBW8486011.1 ATP-binding cassette domain-containing protein [Actinomadura parmotrematis]